MLISWFQQIRLHSFHVRWFFNVTLEAAVKEQWHILIVLLYTCPYKIGVKLRIYLWGGSPDLSVRRQSISEYKVKSCKVMHNCSSLFCNVCLKKTQDLAFLRKLWRPTGDLTILGGQLSIIAVKLLCSVVEGLMLSFLSFGWRWTNLPSVDLYLSTYFFKKFPSFYLGGKLPLPHLC